MRRCFLLCLLLPFFPRAQQIDSLEKALKTMPADTNKVWALRALYLAYYNKDQNGALLPIADQGLELSRSLRFENGINRFIFYKASALDIAGRGREAIPLFEEGLEFAGKTGNRMAQADYHLNLGATFHSLGDQDKALQNFLEAYTLYKQYGQDEFVSKVLNNIGIIYRLQAKYERAEAIYRESLHLKERLKDSLGMATAYQNLAALYNTTGQRQNAVEYLQKALSFYEKLGQTEDIAGCNSLLGEIYYAAGDIPAAKSALGKAVAGYGESPSVEYAPSTFHLLGVIATGEQHYAQAEAWLKKGLELARQFGHRERMLELLKALSKAEYAQGKYAAAFHALQEASDIRDSITEKSRLSLIAEMQTKFDVVQKDNELKINQLYLKQRTTERNWSIAGLGLLALLSLAVFLGFRQRMQAGKKIAAQEAELRRQQMAQLEQAAQLSALQAMIDGQEQERSRIAADLHDGLGGLLTSVKSHVSSLEARPEEAALQQKVGLLIDDACGEVRRISHNMMPRALAVSGLPAALEDLAAGIEKQGIRCTLEIIGLESPLPPATTVTVYRILQELCNNAVKHSRASQLLIQLIRRDHTLMLLTEDDGVGFDLEKALTQKGLGLSSIASRVQLLQGHIEWDTAPGRGASVSITVPV